MKQLSFLIALAMGTLSVAAAELSPDQAWERARAEAASKGMQRVASTHSARLLKTVSSRDNQAAVYVFSDGRTTTFVGADDMAYPVLGYVDNPDFDVNGMPPNMAAWLDEYAREIAWARERQTAKEESLQSKLETSDIAVTTPDGTRLLSSSRRRVTANISPMLSTQWDQGSPYNDLAPMLNGSRTYSGCVATAMAQVLNWHKYPASATGSKTYTWTNGNNQTLSANLAEKSIDWNNMLNTYTATSGTTAQRAAVAWLMKVAAYSVNMNYGGDAQGGSGAAPSAVARALYENFNYDGSVEYKYRCYYEETEWDNMLVQSLQANGPIIYAGFGSGGGHCFVFDGCKTDGTFHINWGWSGSSDGYFRTSSVNPSSLGAGGGTGGGFSNNQGAIFNMKRPAGGARAQSFLGSPAGLGCFFSEENGNIRVDFGVDVASEMLYNCGSYAGKFGIRMQLKGANGATYDTEADYADLDTGYGWRGSKLFYYNLPKVADGDYELWAQYNVDGGAWQSIRWAYGQCHYYKIRISGNKVTVLGRYSNTPDGTVFGYSLNITSLPVFSNEVESVSIGTNIVSTYPGAHAITLAPRICTYEQRDDGWYYVFQTRFPAKTITLNKGNNAVSFTGKVTAHKGEYYLIFCDENNVIVGTPQKITVVGEEGGTGYIEGTGYKLGNFNPGQTANTTLTLYCDSKNSSTATMFCSLKNKASGQTKYGEWLTVTLAGRETRDFVYPFLVPADFPTGEAEFSILRSSTNGPDEEYNGAYLLRPVTVNVGGGSVNPDPDPDPVTGEVTIDVNVTHPVITLGKDNTFTFTVTNGTNAAFTKQIMPRVGTDSNPYMFVTTVEKISVNVPAGSTGTFTATYHPGTHMTPGEYKMFIFDTDFKQYQSRVIPVTVNAAEPDPTPTGEVYATTGRTAYQFEKGKNAIVKLTLTNTTSTAYTGTVLPYLYDTTFRYGSKEGEFSVTVPAGGTLEKTVTFECGTWWDGGNFELRFYDASFKQLQKSVISVKVVDAGGGVIDDSGVSPDPTPEGKVTIDVNVTHPVITIGKDNTFTFTVTNGTNTTFSKQIMPRVGTDDNWFFFSTTVEKFSVNVPAGGTGTFTATFKPYVGQTPGEYKMFIMDTDWNLYQPRVISVTVKAAEPEPDPDPDPQPSNGKLVCDKTVILDPVVPGRAFRYTLSLRNPAATSVTEKVRGYMSSNVGEKFKFEDYFNITLAAGESADRTFSFIVPDDMPVGEATFAVLHEDISALTQYLTVNVEQSAGCPIELVGHTLPDRICAGQANAYTLTLRNNSATEHTFSGFACIENEGQDKREYEFNISVTLAPGETRTHNGVISLGTDYPLGTARFFVINNCTGCTLGYLVNKDVYVNYPSGVEDISADNAPVEWYTLQGVRIFGEPEKGRVYIRRQGNKVEKVRYL